MAATFRLNARSDKWGVIVDLMYLSVNDRSTLGPAAVNAEVSWFIGEVSVNYRVLDRSVSTGPKVHDRRFTLDLLAGLRLHNIQNDITIGPARTAGTKDFVDPILGFDLRVEGSDRWTALLRADIGGFDIGSEFTWNLILGAIYHVSKRFSIGAGYRWLDLDYQDGGFALDLRSEGPFLSFTFHF
jgi:opacity protein-like surface antigen